MNTGKETMPPGHPRHWPLKEATSVSLLLGFALFINTSLALGAAYTDQANGFSVLPPAGWHQDKGPGATASFTSPTLVDGTAANLNVIVKTLPVVITLDDFSSLTSGEIAKTFPGSTKEKTYKGTLDGQPAATTAYTLPVKGRTLVSIQTVVIVGKRVYTLTGTTTEANAKTFGVNNAAFIKSFHVVK